MIRVTHVLWQARFGGIEKLAYDLAVQQAQDPDLRVRIVFGNARGDFLGLFEAAKLDINSVALAGGFDLAPHRLVRARQMLCETDIVHMHGFVVPLALAAWAARKPIVYTEHGNFGFGRKRMFRDRIKQPMYRAFVRHCVRHLTFNSEFTRRVWEERNPTSNVIRSVVSNGIVIDNLTPNGKSTGLEPPLGNAFIVGTTSRLVGFKRVDRLIRAFAPFAAGRNTKLMLIGDGTLRSELEALTRALGIESRTIFTGFRQDVRAIQALMDVCVFPSQNEPFGLAALETLALGKPTLVFADGGGMTDIVRSVCPEDVLETEEHLADRLTDYYQHRSKTADLRQRRIDHARRYDIRATAAAFNAIYKRIS